MFLRYFVFGAHAADGALRGVPARRGSAQQSAREGETSPFEKIESE